jgi:tetratricopeptide (TPR) repeat protein
MLLFFVASRCLVPMDETDLFFNLRLGEIVLGSGRVPTENLLSFTHPHATDVNLAWLFQIILALAHRVAGIPGTVLLKTAFVLGTWAILFRVAVRRGAEPALAALCLALAAWAAEPRFVERPHLVTFLGLALLLLAIERAETGRPRLLWLMAPAGLFWANGNSCYFLAPSLLLLYVLAARREGLPLDARRALLVALAMIPPMFATPSGWHCLTYIANHFRMPYLRPLQEYRHAEWPLDGPFCFLATGLLVAWLPPRLISGLPRLLPGRVMLPCAAVGVLGAFRIRFVAEFAMLAGPALAVAATRLLPRWRWQKPAAIALLAGLALWPRGAAVAAGERALDLGMEPDLVPIAAVDFVERHGLRARMYNDLEVGSYLCWRGWPEHPVFQDPRINGYPEDFHAFLRRTDHSRPEWQRFLDGFGVSSALVTFPSVNPRGALFDPARWALVYRENDGLVFARRPLGPGLREIPLTFTFSQRKGLSPVPIPAPPPGAVVSLCEWHREVGDFHRQGEAYPEALAAYEAALGGADHPSCVAEARVAAGSVAVRLRDHAKALRLLDGATSLVARTNHGFALLGLGRPGDALADFELVLAGDPKNDEATFGRGLSLAAQGQNREAVAAFDALLARSPEHVSAPAARRERERLRGLLGGK